VVLFRVRGWQDYKEQDVVAVVLSLEGCGDEYQREGFPDLHAVDEQVHLPERRFEPAVL
jgi:hypothetical protein